MAIKLSNIILQLWGGIITGYCWNIKREPPSSLKRFFGNRKKLVMAPGDHCKLLEIIHVFDEKAKTK